MTEQLKKGTIDRNSDEAKDRFVTFQTKGVDRDKRTIEIVASTINLDRDGEIILPGAFKKTMGKFLGGNSPFLAAHTHRSNDAAPTQTGWVMTMTLLKAIVTAVVRFARTAVAEQWWILASDPDGKGIAASIGFIPIRWIYGSVADIVTEFSELKPVLAAAGYKDEDRLRVYTEIELLEISGVPVPSNREAIQILAAKNVVSDTQGVTEPTKTGDDLRSEIKNLKSKIENSHKEITGQLAAVRDGLSEVAELINLSSDPLGLSARQEPDAPPADGKATDADESQGAKEPSRLRQAASDLLKTATKN